MLESRNSRERTSDQECAKGGFRGARQAAFAGAMRFAHPPKLLAMHNHFLSRH
jgi:hypothetical protein